MPLLNRFNNYSLYFYNLRVHVTPESVETQMPPFSSTTASLVPSEDMAIEHQFLLPAPVLSVQFAPPFTDVYI